MDWLDAILEKISAWLGKQGYNVQDVHLHFHVGAEGGMVGPVDPPDPGDDGDDDPSLPADAVKMQINSPDAQRPWGIPHFYKRTNSKGHPIMQKYKNEKGNVVRIPNDTAVWVSTKNTQVDGDAGFRTNFARAWYGHPYGTIELFLDRGVLKD
jgi:hypothetical protein